MNVHEILDASVARRFLAEGLWFQRVTVPAAATVAPALRWALELAAGGEPIPPVGVIADVGHLVLGEGRGSQGPRAWPEVPGWSGRLARAYEDLVLGKLDADGTIARASAALARYRGRDRDRGLAFLLDQLRRRAGFGGVLLNPAALKAALESPPEELLAAGWESLIGGGPLAVLHSLYETLNAAMHDLPDALGPEDVFELEHRTALAAFGQRVALRQVVRAATGFEAGVAPDRPRSTARWSDVATRILDEDTYPVGGFSSISTRGSIESLLHSQLAFMEPGERPDLFDIKFVRDELLYYARDENQFFRRRRTFVFALHPGLVLARVKDAELPYQRVVLLLGLLVAVVRRLITWLSDEALRFEFVFLKEGTLDLEPLAAERALVEMVLRDEIASGTVTTDAVARDQLVPRLAARAQRSLTLGLIVATSDQPLALDGLSVAHLRLDGPRPALSLGLGVDDEPAAIPVADDASSTWQIVLERLLASWV